MAVEAGRLVFRSRDENRTFLALLPLDPTLRDGEVRLAAEEASSPWGATLFSGGARQHPTANVGAWRGDHIVLSGLVRRGRPMRVKSDFYTASTHSGRSQVRGWTVQAG